MYQVLSRVIGDVKKEDCGVWLKEAESEKVKAQLFANTLRYLNFGTKINNYFV